MHSYGSGFTADQQQLKETKHQGHHHRQDNLPPMPSAFTPKTECKDEDHQWETDPRDHHIGADTNHVRVEVQRQDNPVSNEEQKTHQCHFREPRGPRSLRFPLGFTWLAGGWVVQVEGY